MPGHGRDADTDLVAQLLDAIDHNDPAPGRPHRELGRDDQPVRPTRADPVDLFTGRGSW